MVILLFTFYCSPAVVKASHHMPYMSTFYPGLSRDLIFSAWSARSRTFIPLRMRCVLSQPVHHTLISASWSGLADSFLHNFFRYSPPFKIFVLFTLLHCTEITGILLVTASCLRKLASISEKLHLISSTQLTLTCFLDVGKIHRWQWLFKFLDHCFGCPVPYKKMFVIFALNLLKFRANIPRFLVLVQCVQFDPYIIPASPIIRSAGSKHFFQITSSIYCKFPS